MPLSMKSESAKKVRGKSEIVC